MIPIGVVTCENRNEYLPTVLGGLKCSLSPDYPPVHVYCDGKANNLPENDWGFRVHETETWQGSWWNHSRAFWRTLWAHPDTDAVIVVEDDILFKPDWYEKIVEAYNENDHRTLGGISGYVGKTQGRYHEREGLYPRWRGKTVGALCWLMTRRLYKAAPLFWETMPKGQNSAYDLRVQTMMELRRLEFRVMRPGIVQHIGKTSLCHPRASGKAGRVDGSVEPPYAGDYNVADYR